MAINGKIVDEINGLIASRDSIRTTMLDASVAGVTNTSKLADLATKLSNAKLGATTYNVSKTDQAIISAGKLTTGAQTIRAVTTSGISAANIKSGAVVKVGDAGSANRITEVTGTFTKEDNNPITAATVLSGKIGYVNGNMVTGSMPNATITSGSATITSTTYTYNSSNGNFGVTGSVAIAAPTVGTAGYISSSAGTRNGGTASLSATVAKIAGSTSISGTTTKQPSISRQSISISNVTDAASGSAQTSAPTSGVWVKVNSAANTGTLTATPSVTTAGYGTKDYHGITSASATVGASASADTYIPIKTGAYSVSVSTTAGSASMSATGVPTSTSATDCYITLSTTAGSVTGTATVGTAGWIDKSSKSSSPTSVSVSGNGTKLYLATYTPSTITVTNSSQTLLTSGKVCTGNITIPAVNYYYTSTATPSSSDGNNGDVWMVTA